MWRSKMKKVLNKYEEETKDDKCPVCKIHPEDAKYIAIPLAPALVFMICQKCGVVYIPKSFQNEMKKFVEKGESRIIKPHTGSVGRA